MMRGDLPPQGSSCKGHASQRDPAAAEGGGAAARVLAASASEGVSCQIQPRWGPTRSTCLFEDCAWGWPKGGGITPA